MSIILELGVTDAVERNIEEDGSVRWDPVPGERVTTFRIPEGTPLADKVKIVLAGLTHTLNPTKKPHWVDSQDTLLKAAIEEHFGIDPDTPRPPQWGDGSNVGD